MSLGRILAVLPGYSNQLSGTGTPLAQSARALLGGALTCMVLWVVPTAPAITLTATDAGFVTSMGGSAKGDGTVSPATYNYSVGWEVHYVDGSLGIPPGSTPLAPMDRKNYFVFDLTGVTTPIATALFTVNAGTYESSDPTETLDLFAPGVMGPAIGDADFLLAENAMGPTKFDEPFDVAVGVAMAHYGNVTAGPAIGTTAVAMIDDDMDLSISIDVEFLNSFLGSVIVFGGELSSLTATGTPEAIMGFTGPDIPGGDPLTPTLELTLVPEPGTGLLLLLGGGIVLFRRRPHR